MTADATPNNVWLTLAHLLAVPEGSAPITAPCHTEDTRKPRKRMHMETGAKVAAPEVFHKVSDSL